MATETSETPTSETVPVATTNREAWDARINQFANLVRKQADLVSAALVNLVGEPSDEALELLADRDSVRDDDLKAALVDTSPKIPLAVFRKHLNVLRGPQSVVTTATEPAREAASGTSLEILLPSLPDDSSFIDMLKVGGVLKVGKTEVIAAMKAAIAEAIGLYDLPEKILSRMEEYAREQEEPVGESFYTLQTLVTSRNYGEILSVLGVSGRFVSERRKTDFLTGLNSQLWPALRQFNDLLKSWQEAWLAGMSNPSAMMAAMAMGAARPGGMMPPGMMAPPETSGLRDGAEAYVNKVNRVFGGVSIPVARALGWDATRIKGILEESGLPAAIGVTNREQMLKALGTSVSADYVRLERSVTRYALAIMDLPQVGVGNEELAYLSAMIQLGLSINWDSLPGSYSAPIPREEPHSKGRSRPY